MSLRGAKAIEPEFFDVAGLSVPVFRFNTVAVGTGCAGHNAADTLHALGQTEVALDPEAAACSFEWKDVRPIPGDGDWFENVWNAYVRGEIVSEDRGEKMKR